MHPNGIIPRVLRYLASTELAIALFAALSLLAIPGTLTQSRAIYSSPLFLGLLGLLALNIIFCSVKRWRSLATSTLILHGGFLVILIGCVVTSFGYIATVNIYEGSSVNQVFRWDMNKDVPLGMDVAVKRINRQYYPVPVRIGVMRGTEKHALFTLKTGESFNLNEYRVTATSFDPGTSEVSLVVHKGDMVIGTADTAGVSTLPADFPYAFKLVSYKNPYLKRIWVDLQLSKDDRLLASGTTEVNGPLSWQGLYFYNTQLATDKSGRAYAGIQIVRDPGRPIVFTGFAIICLGAVLAFFRRFHGAK